jgi:predicted flap endonuclease-1-like 5' DNA nuclease
MLASPLLEGGSQGGTWLIWVVLVVFFIMVLLGWWVSQKGWLKHEAEPAPVDHAHAEAEAVGHAPTQAAADDLTTLEGIGPKVAGVLAGIGITSFEALAKADFATVKAALDGAGYKYMDPSGWIEQAALAAKGDLEGLKKLQDNLKGGRKVA